MLALVTVQVLVLVTGLLAAAALTAAPRPVMVRAAPGPHPPPPSPLCPARTSTKDSTKAIRRFVITEKAPTRAFSWLKAATTNFTFKTLLRHYAKWALILR